MRKLILVAGILLAALNVFPQGIAVRWDNIVTQFSPTNISGRYPLMLWLDAYQVTTPTEGTQQEWIDSSGRGNNATNATTANRPIWHQRQLNGNPAFTFNGTSQLLTTPGFLNGTYNSNFTSYVVCSGKRSTANGGPLSLGDFALVGTGSNTITFNHRLNLYFASCNGGGLLAAQTAMLAVSQPTIQSLICSSTNNQYSINGFMTLDDAVGITIVTNYPYNRPITGITFGNNSISQPVGVGLGFLNTGGNQNWWDGDISEIVVFKGALDASSHAQMVKYLADKWYTAKANLVFVGDSIPAGFTITTGSNFPSQVMYQLGGANGSIGGLSKFEPVVIAGSGWTVAPIAGNGALFAGLVAMAPIQYNNLARTPNDIAVIEGGSNDGDRLFNTNNCYTNFVRLCQETKQAGFKGVVAMTILPRTTLNVATTNQFETFRIGMNTMIRANYTLFADALADVGLDPIIGTHASSSNLLYYSDGCHPTSLGNTIIATNVSRAILSLTTPAAFPVIQSSFISGAINTNWYGAPIQVTGNSFLTAASVAGATRMDLEVPGTITNSWSMTTIVGSIAMSYTNNLSAIVPVGGTFTFTNRSTGAGNASGVNGGQILIY